PSAFCSRESVQQTSCPRVAATREISRPILPYPTHATRIRFLVVERFPGSQPIIVSSPRSSKNVVSTPSAGPRCPRCGRPLAAWRLQHCLYCGETLPSQLKEGFQPPEALKWVERPELPAEVSKTFAMMKLVPSTGARKTRSW